LQGLYQHKGQHKHWINAHTDIHALLGIRTHEPSVREREDSSCFRSRRHCDRRPNILFLEILNGSHVMFNIQGLH
jgi:hypothetical protein